MLAADVGSKYVLWVAQTDELCEQAVQSFRQVWGNGGKDWTELRIVRLWGGNPDPTPSADDAVIASQAVITGAYSLTRQAVALGLLPRLEIRHTSEAHSGQIYVPRVNVALLMGVLLLVGLIRTSSALASAYGIAVATTMVVDGVLGFVVVWKLWGWRWWSAAFLIAPLVVVDGMFLSANLLKLFEGAWVPLLLGTAIVLMILSWRREPAFWYRRRDAPRFHLRCCCAASKKSHRISFPALRYSSPATQPRLQPRCSTTSNTTRFYTSIT